MDIVKTIPFRNSVFTLLVLQSMLLLVVLFSTFDGSVSLLRIPLTVLYLSVGVGVPFALLLHLGKAKPANFLVYSVGLSFAFIMLIGLLMNFLYPYAGISRPMTVYPLLFTFLMVSTSLTLAVAFIGLDQIKIRIKDVQGTWNPLPLVLLHLPLVSIIAITIVNRTGDRRLLFFLFVLLPLLPLVLLHFRGSEKWYPLALFTLSLSVLYPHTLWNQSYPQESWMSAVVHNLGYWKPVLGTGAEQEGILPESLVYSTYSIIGETSPSFQLEVINPFFMSLAPVAAFLLYRRFLSSNQAFVISLLVIFTHNYFFDRWGFGTRDAIASVFLVLFLLVLFDNNIPDLSRKIVASIFLVCIIVSHWGVAFIMVFVMIFVILFVLIEQRLNIVQLSVDTRFNLALFIILTTTTFSWWAVTGGGGGKVHIIITNFSELLTGFTTDGPSAGPSARALQTEVPPSNTALKIMYALLVGLMGVGILQALNRRYQGNQRVVDDEYLCYAIAFLMILGGTFTPMGAFYGTERILSIVFPVTGIFAFLGLWWLGTFIRKQVIAWSKWEISENRLESAVIHIFLAILIIIFSLGVGLVATFSSEDYGQSVVLSNDDLEDSDNPKIQWAAAECYECNGQALVWLANNHHPDYDVMSDYEHNWARYYGFTLVSETSISPHEFLSEDYPLLRQNQNHLRELNSASGTTYIFLHSKNHLTDHYRLDMWDRQLDTELSPLNIQRNQTSKLYTNGESTVQLKESD